MNIDEWCDDVSEQLMLSMQAAETPATFVTTHVSRAIVLPFRVWRKLCRVCASIARRL